MALIQQEPKKIYIRVNAQPITTSGIYHNEDLGLISLSSDGSNWLTIADKNLGATEVWNGGDELTATNGGYYYQRGNNYGFPFTGATTISSTQVNAGTYGPGNYYSSSTFIYNGIYWDSSHNTNLWGGTTGTYEAMQGPCDTGFHITSHDDVILFNNIITSLGITTSLKEMFKMPLMGNLSSSGTPTGRSSRAKFWTTSYAGSDAFYAFSITSSVVETTSSSYEFYGFPIRPFKNTPTQPDDSRTKLY